MAIYKLGEICTYTEGYVNPPVNDKSNFSKDGLPWLKVSELNNGSYLTESRFSLSNKVVKEIKNENQIFKKGTIVWSKSGSVGITSILGFDATANRGILNIIPDEEMILNKFLFYFLIKNKDRYSELSTGAVLKHFYGPNLMNEIIDLPNLKEQRIIIDIIEPIEELLTIIEKKIFTIKRLLVSKYNNCDSKTTFFSKHINLLNSKYEGQILYFATNAISELKVDYSKVQNIEDKIPSRANVTPDVNSFIISKLLGENKIFYFISKPNEVFSTGFFNFKTDSNDHVMGFLLSNSYKNQKEKLSTGTTMKGLNNSSLDNIKMKEPIDNSDILSRSIIMLEQYRIKLDNIKEKAIKLLVK